MAGPLYFSQSDMEARFGKRRVRDVFADDGRAELSERFSQAVGVASRRVETLLAPAWRGTEAIESIIRSDESVFAAGCDLVMADGMKTGRPEWNTGPNPPASVLKSEAEKVLKDYAAGASNPRVEAKIGENPHSRAGKVSTHSFVFAPSNARPRRGGF